MLVPVVDALHALLSTSVPLVLKPGDGTQDLPQPRRSSRFHGPAKNIITEVDVDPTGKASVLGIPIATGKKPGAAKKRKGSPGATGKAKGKGKAGGSGDKSKSPKKKAGGSGKSNKPKKPGKCLWDSD